MSVQPVNARGADQVVTPERRQPGSAAADSRSSTGAMAPHDEVNVSAQARQLAASQEARLQLDFRELREMAFPSQESQGSAE
jgi:tRNA G18 (ribose-2'-O)-methylase SpoU